MATVRKREWQSGGETKSAWIADYSDQGGKRRLKTFARKRDADAWLVQARSEVQRGVHTPESASVTVAEAADKWLRRVEADGRERSTLDQYERHVRLHILPLLGRVKLSALSAPVVEQFRDELLGRVSWKMARKVITSLKSLLKEAKRQGLVGQNAADGVKVDSRNRERRKLAIGRGIPSKTEMAAVLAAAEGKWRPLLLAAAFAGLRASELRGLCWDAVDFNRKVIHVCQRADAWNAIGPPKSAAGDRVIPMAPTLVNALREWRLACPKGEANEMGLVFPTGTGRPQHLANLLQRGLAPIQIKAGVADPVMKDGKPVVEDGKPVLRARYGLHAFRHFFASWLIEQGFGPKKIQSLLGHATIALTYDVYGHLFPSLEDDHAKFAAAELAVTGTTAT